MGKTLLIDDIRDLPAECILRNPDLAEDILKAVKWEVLYLDHDLGEGCITGYDILCWLEENPEYLPKRIELVTDNPVGRKRMQQVLDKLYKK